MAYTYSGDPTTSAKDEIRFLVQDTGPTKWYLQDAEISYQISLVSGTLQNAPAQGNFLAAAYCADAIMAQFSSLAESKAVGDLNLSYSKRVENYQALAYRLRQRAAIAGVPLTVTGQSLAKKKILLGDPDATKAEVVVDGMNYAAPADVLQGSDGSVGP
jgi:hypothetical protein